VCSHCLAHKEAREALEQIFDIVLHPAPPPPEWARSYLDLAEEIPAGLPDGTGILSPIAWVRWAKEQLGYPPLVSQQERPRGPGEARESASVTIFDDTIIKSSIVMSMIFIPPTQPAKTPDTEYIIPVAIIKLAKDAQAEYIHKDGSKCYRWRYDRMEEAKIENGQVGSWWGIEGDLAAGELREL
jgi:hypothetical protein